MALAGERAGSLLAMKSPVMGRGGSADGIAKTDQPAAGFRIPTRLGAFHFSAAFAIRPCPAGAWRSDVLCLCLRGLGAVHLHAGVGGAAQILGPWLYCFPLPHARARRPAAG